MGISKSATQTWLLIGLILIGASVAEDTSAQDKGPQIGQTLKNFQLNSHRGVQWALADVADKEVLVLVFLGTECPLAKLYGPRLAELQQRYAKQSVAFVGINSNRQDSVTEITAFVARHKISFPVLKDVGNRLADEVGALRTPEVFVFDKTRKLRYHGRIDDQYLVGLSRPRPKRPDLAMAINELLAGKPVSQPKTNVVGCYIGRVRQTPQKGHITYTKHIARIFNKRCVECHRQGEIAPFTLTRYEDILGWEDTILEVIKDNRMPPWFANPAHGTFRNDASLSKEEKRLIRQWVENGMPRGDLADLPPARKFPKGWRVREPDQVVYMRDEGKKFEVPAQGVVDYQYFVRDPKWKEDKYITLAEARPDNKLVVHHIVIYIQPPGTERADPRNREMLAGYAPGANPLQLPDGHAIRVPAGSKLIFEMHYTPNGSRQFDRSYVGFNFLEKSKVKRLVTGRMAINLDVEIEAGARDHVETSRYYSPRDEVLLNLTPHMHLRGKAFRYEVIFKDGRKETCSMCRSTTSTGS